MRTMIWSLLFLAVAAEAGAQSEPHVEVRNDSVVVRLVDVDLRLAIQSLAPHLERPIVFGSLGDYRVTLESPSPVPVLEIASLLQGILQIHGLRLVDAETHYVVDAIQPAPAMEQQVQETASAQLYVLRLRHARATDVAATVNALYGRGGALGEPGAPFRTLDESLRQNVIPQAGAPEGGAPPPVIEMVAELAGDVTIIPDTRTNSLLVRASPRDFELIRAAVQEVDIRPLQVLIEVIIAEVRRDRSLGLGVDAVLPPIRVPGTTDTELSASSGGLGLGDFVVSVMNLGGADLSLVLRAAATRGDATILSRPVLLAANNELAEIMVGSQRPFIQVQRALPTDAPIRDQVVQFKDVGTRLSVLPTVSEDGYVMLEVAQEVNAATAEVAFNAPVISTRSVRTQLLVRDGQTAVLGGLADRQKETTRTGVPILSAIPLLGSLFGSQVERTTETELFVFLTPRVIRTDEDVDAAAEAVGGETRRVVGGVGPIGGR